MLTGDEIEAMEQERLKNLLEGGHSAHWIDDAIRSDVWGIGTDRKKLKESVAFYAGQSRFMQLCFVTWLAGRDARDAYLALRHMAQLRDLANDTAAARREERDLIGDDEVME